MCEKLNLNIFCFFFFSCEHGKNKNAIKSDLCEKNVDYCQTSKFLIQHFCFVLFRRNARRIIEHFSLKTQQTKLIMLVIFLSMIVMFGL